MVGDGRWFGGEMSNQPLQITILIGDKLFRGL